MRGICCLVVLALVASSAPTIARADEADSFFDATEVGEIHLVFDDPGWYDTLYDAHASDPEDPYFPASFRYGESVLDPVGVRFKGNSSFGIQGVKKSFKIDFNEYEDELRFLGLVKLNLNNGFKDPSFLRERLFLDFARQYVPTIRATHVRVFINGVYWGLYLAVEQIDKTFAQSRFSDQEDGNLFKAAASDDAGPRADFGSDLTWLGDDPEPYHDSYQLKTNEEEDDYSQLIEFIDVLNNASTSELPSQLEPIFDVGGCLAALALNNLFVNLDAYNGSAHNYYLYDRDGSGQLTHIHWDTNEAFARFLMFMTPGQNPLRMDPFWLPTAMPGQPVQSRPLMERLWAVDSYRTEYLRSLARLLREGFDAPTMEQRITELADMIRADVYEDPNKPFTNADFETSLSHDLGSGPNLVYGLLHFVAERAAWMDHHLDTFAAPTDLRLNEVMTVNVGTANDESGDYDPWVEIVNLGPGRLPTGSLHLTDDPAEPTKWAFPAGELDDGRYIVVWLDGEPGEGGLHASFTVDGNGGEVSLFASNGGVPELVDRVTVPALANDRSWARVPDGDGGWSSTDRPTPGAANIAGSVVLRINELMADNDTTIEDPQGNGGYPDWIEIYNPGDDAVEMGGLYLTDDLDDPSTWQVPEGVIIEARGFLLVWADNDEAQGATHAGFCVDAEGEELGLFASDGVTLIDSVVFGEQRADVSWGRLPDGGEEWTYLARPTPGAGNEQRPRHVRGRVRSP